MTYKGHVENGAVVLDETAALPDGALVTIEVAVAKPFEQGDGGESLAEHYRCVIGALDAMPDDWSENHDAYLRAQYGS